jgi:hypothetical protein
MTITNFYYIFDTKKIYYASFADAIIGMSLNHPMLFYLSPNPEQWIQEYSVEFKSITI